MEIIAELLLQALWFVIQFVFELVVQLVAELLGEAIGRGAAAAWRRRPPHPAFSAAAYLLFGALFGAISLWLLPEHFIEPPWARWLNLLLTPVAAGVVMALVGAWRRERGLAVIRLDTFLYGYVFALGMAGVRFIWGQ